MQQVGVCSNNNRYYILYDQVLFNWLNDYCMLMIGSLTLLSPANLQGWLLMVAVLWIVVNRMSIKLMTNKSLLKIMMIKDACPPVILSFQTGLIQVNRLPGHLQTLFPYFCGFFL